MINHNKFGSTLSGKVNTKLNANKKKQSIELQQYHETRERERANAVVHRQCIATHTKQWQTKFKFTNFCRCCDALICLFGCYKKAGETSKLSCNDTTSLQNLAWQGRSHTPLWWLNLCSVTYSRERARETHSSIANDFIIDASTQLKWWAASKKASQKRKPQKKRREITNPFRFILHILASSHFQHYFLFAWLSAVRFFPLCFGEGSCCVNVSYLFWNYYTRISNEVHHGCWSLCSLIFFPFDGILCNTRVLYGIGEGACFTHLWKIHLDLVYGL